MQDYWVLLEEIKIHIKEEYLYMKGKISLASD